MQARILLLLLLIAEVFTCGCGQPWQRLPDGRHHSDIMDAVFRRRHYDSHADAAHDPIMALARDITVIEDDLRRDGTITVKKPDVWGDGNLVYFLQEFDQQLARRTGEFEETLQAYIARSDQSEFQSSTGLAVALSGKNPSGVPAGTSSNQTNNTNVTVPPAPSAEFITLPEVDFNRLKKAVEAAPPANPGIGVEPTELARQHATFVDVCQALRRRHMGDDNSRAAGYGLYKFRIPVSVLPGRETEKGHSAVVTLRAQIQVDEANLRYTFPKLVIADLVDKLTPIVRNKWNDEPKTATSSEIKAEGCEALERQMEQHKFCPAVELSLCRFLADNQQQKEAGQNGEVVASPTAEDSPQSCQIGLKECIGEVLSAMKSHKEPCYRELYGCLMKFYQALNMPQESPEDTIPPREQSLVSGVPADPGAQASINIYGENTILVLKEAIKKNFDYDDGSSSPPAVQEIRAALSSYLGQVQSVLERNAAFDHQAKIIWFAGDGVAKGQFKNVNALHTQWDSNVSVYGLDEAYEKTSWLIAVQSGILNENLHRMLEELRTREKLSDWEADFVRSPAILFFATPTEEEPSLPRETVQLWQTIVREGFPLTVVTLDSQVEEQNVYDAFSRLREMQLALAYNVATGRFNMAQKLAYSRQLALDQAAIGLNRTVVGFSHGNDTFGWYFYPRVQSPPTESTNIEAFARTIWSTGPTEHYDLKHRHLEPGIRECEVLVAMPSFVSEISFDITTNWESLAKPGITKRSYEEMLAQGSLIHQMKHSLGDSLGGDCYRPGDVERLLSRIDQLENMLGMQTQTVNVPYEYEQSGTDLFDTGDVQLRPVLTGYYGVDLLLPAADKDHPNPADLFLTGKNFHPTLTHVIIGGVEGDTLMVEGKAAKVEVINRQLLRVNVSGLLKGLSKDGFEIRVGTPAGLSNPQRVKPVAEQRPTPKGWSFSDPQQIQGVLFDRCCKGCKLARFMCVNSVFTLETNVDEPLPSDMDGHLLILVTGKKKDGTAIKFNGADSISSINDIPICRKTLKEWVVDAAKLEALLDETLRLNLPDVRNEAIVLSVTGYLAFDKYPVTKTTNTLQITLEPCECPAEGVPAAGPDEESRTEVPDEPKPEASVVPGESDESGASEPASSTQELFPPQNKEAVPRADSTGPALRGASLEPRLRSNSKPVSDDWRAARSASHHEEENPRLKATRRNSPLRSTPEETPSSPSYYTR